MPEITTAVEPGTYVVEPRNTVLTPSVFGLHPQSATRCVNVEGWMRQNYASTIANWNHLTPDFRRWWLRQERRLKEQGVEL